MDSSREPKISIHWKTVPEKENTIEIKPIKRLRRNHRARIEMIGDRLFQPIFKFFEEPYRHSVGTKYDITLKIQVRDIDLTSLTGYLMIHLIETFNFQITKIKDDRRKIARNQFDWIQKCPNSVNQLFLNAYSELSDIFLQLFHHFLSPFDIETTVNVLDKLKNSQDLSIEMNHTKIHITQNNGLNELLMEINAGRVHPLLWDLDYHTMKISSCTGVNDFLKSWITRKTVSEKIVNIILEIEEFIPFWKILYDIPHIKKMEEWSHPVYGQVDFCYQIQKTNKSKKAWLFDYFENDGKRFLVMYIQ